MLTTYLAPSGPFDRPHLIHTILTQPLHLLIRLTSHFLTALRPLPPSSRNHARKIRIVCISDTHSLDPGPIPMGDILIHSGDITAHGTPVELPSAINALSPLPHAHKFIITANHDTYLDPNSRVTLSKEDQTPTKPLDWKNLTYLQHTTATIKVQIPTSSPSSSASSSQTQHGPPRSLTIHGSPQTPLPNPTFAFTYPAHQDAWTSTLPPETDILITHSPPATLLDLPHAMGCPYLLSEVARTKPLLHVFGHVHAGRSDFEGWLMGGRTRVVWDKGAKARRRGLGRRARGLVWDLCNLGLWMDLGLVVFYGVKAVVWERVWGGRLGGENTVFVNAAMMFEGSGRLGNGVQVVDI